MKMPATQLMEKWLARLLRGGIRFRILLLVGLIILPFAGLLGWIYHQRYESRKTNALETEQEVAHGLAVTFTTYIDGIRKQSLSLGHAILILSPTHEDKITELLMTAAGHASSVRNMSWVSPQGVVLASSAPGFSGASLSARGYFRKIVAGQPMAVEDLSPTGAISNRPTVAMATAIRDYRGKLMGAVVAAIEPTRLEEVVLRQKRPAGGALVLFDSRGILVYHSMLNVPTWEQRVAWAKDDSVLSHVLQSGREEAAIQTLKLRTGKWVSARVPLPELGWVAGAGRPTSIAFAEVRQGMVQDALLGTAVFALAFLLAYLLGRNISAPLRRLERDALLMGEGKLIQRIDPFAPFEVGNLRATLVTMTGDLIRRAHELQESETTLRTIFDNVYDGILIHSLDGRIVEVNRRWLEMFRLGPGQVKELTISDLSPDAPPVESFAPLWSEVMAGQTKLFEWRALRPGDGSEFDMEVFLCRIRFKGGNLIMANVRDITDRKRIAQEMQKAKDELELRVQERTHDLADAFEELQKETAERIAAVEEMRRREQLLIQQSRLTAMAEMIVNISHHWRQPLNIIGLVVQELALTYRQDRLSEVELEDRVSKAMDVLNTMSRTIDDFRSLLSPDEVRIRFATREVVDKALSLMEGDFRQLQVQVAVTAREECPVEGFRNEYAQVILNILANARDVFQERKVQHPRIAVNLFCEDGRSVVTIADNGGGMADEIVDRVFEPYFTTKAPGKGTGIGLFMAKNIIEKNMSGRLSARNTGEGAEFRIEMAEHHAL